MKKLSGLVRLEGLHSCYKLTYWYLHQVRTDSRQSQQPSFRQYQQWWCSDLHKQKLQTLFQDKIADKFLPGDRRLSLCFASSESLSSTSSPLPLGRSSSSAKPEFINNLIKYFHAKKFKLESILMVISGFYEFS